MAVRLGRADVHGMLRSLTARQFYEWQMYVVLEPFVFDAELRADYRAALIAQTFANVNRGKKQKAFKLEDFLLQFGEPKPKRQQTSQEMFNVLKILAMQQAVAE